MASNISDNSKLDWMYKGPFATEDREEYLLGKSVDKSYENIQENLGKQVPSVKEIWYSTLTKSLPNVQVDLARKVQEDPLVKIRKETEENKRKILENPVKMKMIMKLVKQKESEINLIKSQRKIKKKKKKMKISSSESVESEIDEKLKKHLKKMKKKKELYEVLTENDSKIMSDDKHRTRILQRNIYRNSYQEARAEFKKQYEEKRRVLNEEEMEKKRKEMMRNVEWQKQQSKLRLEKHKKKQQQEEIMTNEGYKPIFIHQQLSVAAASTSLSSRIRSNIYNIQRSKSAMEKNFARR